MRLSITAASGFTSALSIRKANEPTPVRLALRSKEGRYIPPYGHRTEINDGWFQDYGADVKLMDTRSLMSTARFKWNFRRANFTWR